MASHLRQTSIAVAVTLLAGLSAAVTATPAQAAGDYNYLVFNKNWSDQTKSSLTLYRYLSSRDRVVKVDSWRAGSGSNHNACRHNGGGWLPNGTYKIKTKQKNFDGTKIKGYVMQLADFRCGNNQLRDELFIHSEMKKNGYPGSSEQWRWTDSNPNDYYSAGCVKLRPSAIKELFEYAKPTKLVVVT
ncbi:L,D-transpeptidase [Streptomyces sp. NBC_01304]|uniref:L,D-transpeptidase n=1 Tax=Streptomyces sp. NBC_01304 TaxID=2903818 RepID=UPI002E15ADCB|nr:L,D-transpeptidase [Streptomyces sp. NBC_01304]